MDDAYIWTIIEKKLLDNIFNENYKKTLINAYKLYKDKIYNFKNYEEYIKYFSSVIDDSEEIYYLEVVIKWNFENINKNPQNINEKLQNINENPQNINEKPQNINENPQNINEKTQNNINQIIKLNKIINTIQIHNNKYNKHNNLNNNNNSLKRKYEMIESNNSNIQLKNNNTKKHRKI